MKWNPFGYAFCRALRAERREANIKYDDMAARIGIRVGTYLHIESGYFHLTDEFAVRFATVLPPETLDFQKFTTALTAARALERISKRSGLKLSTSYIRELMDLEPELGTCIWNLVSRLGRVELQSMRERRRLIDDLGAADRVRSYWRPDEERIRAPALTLPREVALL